MNMLNELSTQLKLSYFREHASEAIAKARKKGQDYESFLTELMEGEMRLLIEKSASILFIPHQCHHCLTEYLH